MLRGTNPMIRFMAAFLLMACWALPCSMSFKKMVYYKHHGSDTHLFRFEQNGRAGFMDATGKIAIPARFEPDWFANEDFFEGLSTAQYKEDKWGFIDKKGKWVVKPEF